MIRTVVTPDIQNILIELPQNYVGKQIEIIAFRIDEANEKNVIEDNILTHFASEKVLAKDWLSQEEDIAWQNL
jgi:RNA binding exosome subunit